MDKIDWSKKTIFLTGGTGSFGKKFTEVMLEKYKPQKLIIFSRDELKQYEMMQVFKHKSLRFFIGDVRDTVRLHRAMHGVNIVVHAAALKQVPACEYNPFEAIKTNIMGAENIINVAIDNGVEQVLALSTDKAVNPVNLYGATKMCAEKLFTSGNAYAGGNKTRMATVRYGNVVGSRGSVVPLFKKQALTGVFTITDKAMTRFWLTLEDGVKFVVNAICEMQGGEVFVPKIPSMRMTDLAKAMNPKAKLKIIGIRPGEKIHEVLLTEDEARHSRDMGKYFIIEPESAAWHYKSFSKGKKVPEGFKYSSDNNKVWLTPPQLLKMIAK